MKNIMKVTIQLSCYMLVTFLLLELCIASASAVKRPSSSVDIKHRSRRQTGDIYLLGLKAKSSIMGTTRPSEYFRRIGKKRAQKMADPSHYAKLRGLLQPLQYEDDIFAL